ncbi:MAG TPA: Nif3-like dinuclear metal center hexameric protein [Microbacteriaceae bacterium]|nr:Nif3-like dinuclear metal center hexameric protein [Microbacteriaceae bacterium]
MTTLRELTESVHSLWPLESAEPWDTPGLVAGRGEWEVRRVLIAVDAVRDTVDEAVNGQFDVLLTHHPLLLRGVTSVADDRAKGDLLTSLISSRVGMLSAHTNADIVDSGATQVLAGLLGLQNLSPIAPTVSDAIGLGRVGELAEPTTLGELARRLADVLPATAGGVRGAGDWNRPVSRVALCSGAGDSLLEHPIVRGSDVYITSDLRHHPAQEAIELGRVAGGPALLDVSHWASEWLWCASAARELGALLPNLDFQVSDLRTDPWDFAVLPAERNA